MRYDEYIVAHPRATSEDLSRNHAAGLSHTREQVTRCRDCDWYDGAIHSCGRIDQMAGSTVTHVFDDDFCCWAKRITDEEYEARWGYTREEYGLMVESRERQRVLQEFGLSEEAIKNATLDELWKQFKEEWGLG